MCIERDDRSGDPLPRPGLGSDAPRCGPASNAAGPTSASESDAGPGASIGRRAVLARAALSGLAGGGLLSLLGGCATGGSANDSMQAAGLPAPPWPSEGRAVIRRPDTPGRAGPVRRAPTRAAPRTAPAASRTFTRPSGVIARSSWNAASPVTGEMDPMLPIQHITVHHDALDYESFSRADARQRMARVQSAHQQGNGWADIGYHFVIDRSGAVWEGRPLQWQGAHVKDRNEGNIGVMLMGNFEVHQPSEAQVQTVARFVPELQRTHRVSRSNVRSHREWDSASTLCPGRYMQARLNRLRSDRAFG